MGIYCKVQSEKLDSYCLIPAFPMDLGVKVLID